MDNVNGWSLRISENAFHFTSQTEFDFVFCSYELLVISSNTTSSLLIPRLQKKCTWQSIQRRRSSTEICKGGEGLAGCGETNRSGQWGAQPLCLRSSALLLRHIRALSSLLCSQSSALRPWPRLLEARRSSGLGVTIHCSCLLQKKQAGFKTENIQNAHASVCVEEGTQTSRLTDALTRTQLFEDMFVRRPGHSGAGALWLLQLLVKVNAMFLTPSNGEDARFRWTQRLRVSWRPGVTTRPPVSSSTALWGPLRTVNSPVGCVSKGALAVSTGKAALRRLSGCMVLKPVRKSFFSVWNIPMNQYWYISRRYASQHTTHRNK